MGRNVTTSVIKSIQRGTISLSSGASSATATLTAVDPAKTLLIFLGASGSDTAVRIALTDATTVTAYHATGGMTTTTVGYEAIEFW